MKIQDLPPRIKELALKRQEEAVDMENSKQKSLNEYIKLKKNQDECSSFIDGYEQALRDIAPTFGTWISVEERLPKRNERVIAYFPKGSTSPMDSMFNGKEFFVDGIDRTKFVTHWMPLPLPPKYEPKSK